jgi:hypothetical protein
MEVPNLAGGGIPGVGDRSDLGEIICPRGVGYAASSTGPLWWVKPGPGIPVRSRPLGPASRRGGGGW